ncbi:hypothetical protein COL154_011048 [Colletotrichum chrysophilum]|uniref:uncharacterized protein n=1 Tax=Colletotrichum chrysophilum TaxID=1836956 RepID=UPI0023009083|nr:uncharacterized protein COL26b_002537 [Colletotrichum chrysophilum]KAJ0340355.1 hypothetical protein KNSL1_011599 [Colletotrichum chrysophilum]KAJ0356172.1 hypothetical protein COL154_011048 [Colletotrichum chrysophilum]KAJ0379062.1 hypothetical protein COL26b_002537 [Colletotrichum chrysophilum]
MVNFVLGAVATLAAVAPLAAAAPAATPAPEIFSFAKWVDGIIANPYGDNLTPEEAVEAYYKSVNASEAASLDWDYGRARKRDDAAEGASPEWDYGKRDEVPEAATPDWDYGRARKRDDADEAATPDWDYGRARKRDDVTEGATPEWDYGKRNEVPEAASPDWDYGRVRKRATCNTIAGTQASVADAVSCINYLAGLGSTSCVVSNAKSHFCTIGNAQITGVTSGSIPAASSCNDVARGAGYIMDACTLKDNTVQGSEFAYGNGDLLVWIRKPE